MAKRTPSPRTAAIRAWKAEREATIDRCKIHKHALHTLTRYGQPFRYKCGCLAGGVRN